MKEITCPKCGKELDGLRHVQSGKNYYDCWLTNNNKYMDYQHDEFESDGEVSEWYCPECDKTLFTNEDEAVKFLKGE